MELILASTSPRRRELIQLFALDFHLAAVDVDETPDIGESPEHLVTRLCRAKAMTAAQRFPHALIIAADTVVALDDEILGKPKDLRDAERMLKQLRGREHLVYSGVCTLNGARQHIPGNATSRAKEWTQVVQTSVTMRKYTNTQIAAYIATDDPLDKAAAYAIQHNGFRPVGKIAGCYANVMGLPLCHLYLALKKFGVAVNEPAVGCQSHLRIDCPVAKTITSTVISDS